MRSRFPARQRARRESELAKAFSLLAPQAPYCDAEAIRAAAAQPHLVTLPPGTAIWLATVAHIRHRYTDYDTLLADGYDYDAARHFTLEPINEVLTRWRATRLLDPHSPDDG